MSQAEIGNLRVRMGLDTAEFNSGVRNVQGSIAGLSSTLKGFATAAAAMTVFNATVSAVKAVAEIGDVAESIGVTAEQLQVFQKMAIASGTSTDVLTRGLQSLAEQSVQSGSALEKLFTANGMTLAGKETNQIIREFMDLVQNARTPTEQLAIITEVLGDKVGRQLVESFRQGANGVDEQYRRMNSSGEILLNAEVARLQELETQYNQVADRIATYWRKTVVGIISALDSIKMEYVPGSGGGRSAVANRPAPGAATGLPDLKTEGGRGDLSGNIDPNTYKLKKTTVMPPPPVAKTSSVKTTSPFDSLQAQGRGVWDSTRTSVEKYQIEIRKLNDLLRVGAIDNDTYSRAIKQLQDGFTEAMPEAVNFGQALLGIADSIASGLSDALTGLITGTMSAKEAFAQMAQSIIQSLSDIAAELVRSGILKLLSGVLGGMAGGGGAGFNLGGMMFGGVYANGGYLGSGKWGIAGEAGPEIIHGPARITPMDKLGGGNGVNVTVINNTPARVNTRQGADGGLTIEVVEEAVATAISRGGNKIDSAMQRGFGLRRAGR